MRTTCASQARPGPALRLLVGRAGRGLVLVLKANLEAVEAGITTIEQEFLADMVLPGVGAIPLQVTR